MAVVVVVVALVVTAVVAPAVASAVASAESAAPPEPGSSPKLRVDGRWDSPLLRVHENQLTARTAFDTVFTPMQLPVVVTAQR